MVNGAKKKKIGIINWIDESKCLVVGVVIEKDVFFFKLEENN